MSLDLALDREEYIEQTYFFRAFRERLKENLAAQEILASVHEELLATTRLPFAVQFLATELKHSGLLAFGLERLSHYFTPFQAFVIRKAEEQGMRFSMDMALRVLEKEATYRSERPTQTGLFVFQFEVLSRNRLGYDEGLRAMAEDRFYDDGWRQYMETVRRNIGEIDFADLLYLRSELYVKDQQRQGKDQETPPALFGEKEGKIARASRGRDPLHLFAALQRQMGYPEVPRPLPKDDLETKLLATQVKLRELEMKLQVVESELRGRTEAIELLGKPEIFKDDQD